MSLSNPRTFLAKAAVTVLLSATLGLTACGYRPLYATNSSANAPVVAQLSAIHVANIPDRAGQQMRLALTHKLSRRTTSQPDAYELTVTLSESIQELAIEKDAFATRANLRLTASYKLIRLQDNFELDSGGLKTIASYNILSSDYATLSAQRDARDNAINNLADDLYTRLAAYFRGPGANPPPLKSTRQPAL